MDEVRDKIRAKLESIGEDQARENVSLGLYKGRKLVFAKEWLRQQEEIRTSESKKSKEETTQEQTRIAHSTRNAIWATAIIAAIAVIITIWRFYPF